MPHGFVCYYQPVFGMKEEAMEGIRSGEEWIKEIIG
jgi:hypothetical protein